MALSLAVLCVWRTTALRQGAGAAAVRDYMDDAAPIHWVGKEVCDERMKVLPGLPVSAAMAPVGVVPLLGGVAEECRHFPISHLVLVVVSG